MAQGTLGYQLWGGGGEEREREEEEGGGVGGESNLLGLILCEMFP